ncbi:hypothetical protein CEXT_640841 [Caerostris extrusa]|uniref:Uncharacterized protein n=1 Tax=Caerostris extrusa TaxID=172846 RepID=A0AAV4MWR8_CAEEX|nr:hypothetical protein CEXT_640841 [Caerostris extrusa]
MKNKFVNERKEGKITAASIPERHFAKVPNERMRNCIKSRSQAPLFGEEPLLKSFSPRSYFIHYRISPPNFFSSLLSTLSRRQQIRLQHGSFLHIASRHQKVQPQISAKMNY